MASIPAARAPLSVAVRLLYEAERGADRWGRWQLACPRLLSRLSPAPASLALASVVANIAAFYFINDINVRNFEI